MVATSGDPLLQEEAVATLRDELIPTVRVITPNIPEAELLLGRRIGRQEELPEAARALSCGGRVSVFLKAGHLHDRELVDIFYNAEEDRILPLRSERLDTPNTHGTAARSPRHSRPSWPAARGSTRRQRMPRSISPERSPQARPTASATDTVPCTTLPLLGVTSHRKKPGIRQSPAFSSSLRHGPNASAWCGK